MNSIPVFVFPDSLVFQTNNQRVNLTLYNPYDFSIRFQILATNPNAFALTAAEGTVRARHALDIVVRIRETNTIHERLLIQIHEQNGNRRGDRQMDVSRDTHIPQPNTERAFSPCQHSGNASESREMPSREVIPKSAANQTLIACLAAFCALVLMVPHESQHWLRVDVTVKLVFAYFLGVLTVAFINK